MCAICGCGDGEMRVPHHDHGAGDGHHHHDEMAEPHHAGGGRLLSVEQEILAKNDRFAGANRARLRKLGGLGLNLMSSPGAGKTTLLAATAAALGRERPTFVIVGDQETSEDADRIAAAGVPAIQINTGRGCHLDAHMVGHALDDLKLREGGIVFIENIGNLVCPAAFDLGETHKIVMLSVTEGENKPIKYPDIFAASGLMLVTKVDLLPHLDFEVDRCIEYARRVNPAIEVLRVSARTSEGMEEWLEWIRASSARLCSEAAVETGESRPKTAVAAA